MLQASNPPVALNLENLKDALMEEFVKAEDSDKVWQEIQQLEQKGGHPIDDYINKFSSLWENLCKALWPQVPPAHKMKKDRVWRVLGITCAGGWN